MKLDEKHSAIGDASATAPHAPETRQERPKRETGTRNRRARGAGPKSRGKTPAKRSNGHPGVNGHDRASGPSAVLAAPGGQGSAASVDANGASAASAAISAAAGTDRDAYAEVAQASNGRERPRNAGARSRAVGRKPRASGDIGARRFSRKNAVSSGERKKAPLGRGETPLPIDSAGFVDAIHARVDLLEVGENLLRSNDEKVVQRAFERMLDIKFGRGAAAALADAPTVIWDVPGVNLNRNEG